MRKDPRPARGAGAAALLCGVLAGLAAPPAAAGQGMPFHTPTALPLPLAESGLRSYWQHLEVGSLLRDGEEVGNPEGLRAAADVVPLLIPHGIARRTFVMAGVPFVWKTLERGGASETNRGLGDLSFTLKHEILARDFVAGNRRLALFAGAAFPTGETEDAGEPLPPALRLGAGSVTLAGRAVYSYVNDRFGYHGALGYAAATGEEAGVRRGDRFLYDLALGLRLFPSTYRTLRDVTLAAYLELNGTVEQPAAAGDELVPDSGGHTLFLSPGLQLIPLPNWALEASFQYPIVRELQGTQLGPEWSLSVGARTVVFLFGS